MIGFSIMMWFISVILFIVSISLLKGNTSSMHGKVYDTTSDRVGYGKASGKVTLFMAIGILSCGIVALIGNEISGIRNAMIILVLVIAIATYFFIRIQHKFSN